MNIDAAPHPLLVPELISLVLSFLRDDRHSLFTALLVHPTWTKYGVPILWRKVELDVAFHFVPSERRQLYADQVKQLSMRFKSFCPTKADFALKFSRLQVLSTYVEYATVPALVSAVQQAPLARLELHVRGSKHTSDFLPRLATLLTLKVLYVRVDAITLERDDLLSLEALTGLHELRINGENYHSSQIANAPEFAVGHLVRLLRSLPCLQRLEIYLEWDPFDDGSCLRRVGEAAPALEELKFWGWHCIQTLDPCAAAPLFPRLATLCLTGLQLQMPSGAEDETDAEELQ